MSWLRVDDKLARHPKILKLTRADRWTWTELLCYCAEYRTDGEVPEDIGEALRYVTPTFIDKAVAAGLLDRIIAPEYIRISVHDWDDYNGRDPKILQTERKRKSREQAKTDTEVPGQRRDTDVTDAGHDRDENGTRAQAPGRVPHPHPHPQTTSQSVNPLLDQTENENGDRLTDQNQFGRTAEEQARIDAIDNWWKDEPATGVLERDPYVEPFNDLSPLGEQLAAAKAREEQER